MNIITVKTMQVAGGLCFVCANGEGEGNRA